MMSGHPSVPLFTVLRILLLSVRLTFMDASDGLWHTHHQSSLGFSHSTTSLRGARIRVNVGFQFNVQKWSVPESGDAFLAKKPCLDPNPNGHQGGRKSVGGACTSSTDSKKKGGHGGCHS